MQDFRYNIIDKIVNRKMTRLNQIVDRIEINTCSIQELMQLSEEMEHLSSSIIPYFEIRHFKSKNHK